MNVTIRKMLPKDKDAVLEMMRIFYRSPAVLSNGSEEIFQSDVEACIGESPYLEGFVMEAAGQILGYSMVAKSFSLLSTGFISPGFFLSGRFNISPALNNDKSKEVM